MSDNGYIVSICKPGGVGVYGVYRIINRYRVSVAGLVEVAGVTAGSLEAQAHRCKYTCTVWGFPEKVIAAPTAMEMMEVLRRDDRMVILKALAQSL